MRSTLLTFCLLAIFAVCSAQKSSDSHQTAASTEKTTMSETLEDKTPVEDSRPAQSAEDEVTPHESDDEPMVYRTPRDYATWARGERDRLIASGVSSDNVILQSKVSDHIPRQEDESTEDYMKRYIEAFNAMIRRGVKILNDQTTADVVPDVFSISDGRSFDLGPKSGATKGEYRDFSNWFHEKGQTDDADEVPERFLKFESKNEGREEL